MNLAELRRIYSHGELDESAAPANPLELFQLWFEQAIAAELREANAMALATATATGAPSVRMVLMKDFDPRGISFFTNYESRKGRELAENPQASLLFFWNELERQVRIEGTVERLPAEQSQQYFSSRPEGSQLGAWASPQSQVVASRAWLEASMARSAEQFRAQAISRPAHWGGYIVVPEVFEFWQGRPNRMHDRIRYRRDGEHWIKDRLAP